MKRPLPSIIRGRPVFKDFDGHFYCMVWCGSAVRADIDTLSPEGAVEFHVSECEACRGATSTGRSSAD